MGEPTEGLQERAEKALARLEILSRHAHSNGVRVDPLAMVAPLRDIRSALDGGDAVATPPADDRASGALQRVIQDACYAHGFGLFGDALDSIEKALFEAWGKDTARMWHIREFVFRALMSATEGQAEAAADGDEERAGKAWGEKRALAEVLALFPSAEGIETGSPNWLSRKIAEIDPTRPNDPRKVAKVAAEFVRCWSFTPTPAPGLRCELGHGHTGPHQASGGEDGVAVWGDERWGRKVVGDVGKGRPKVSDLVRELTKPVAGTGGYAGPANPKPPTPAQVPHPTPKREGHTVELAPGTVFRLGKRWQPIESAPKDGTEVLLSWLDATFVGWWVDRFVPPGVTDDGRAWRGEWTCAGGALLKPTHWTPLPDAPTETEGET